jgi:hypothetical protein
MKKQIGPVMTSAGNQNGLGEKRIAGTVSAGAERGPDRETKRSRTGDPVRGPGGENGLSRGKSMSGEEKADQAAKTGTWAAKTKKNLRRESGLRTKNLSGQRQLLG